MPVADFQNVKHKIISPLITPDTQRDAVRLNVDGGKTIQENHNHCKNTSCTMMTNWLGQNFESLATLGKMGEYAYNNNLLPFVQPGEIIQAWPPHVKFINQMLVNGKVPLKAELVNFRSNFSKVMYSLLVNGFPVVLGTMITSSGHIVLLVGMTANGDYIIIDPYGQAPNYMNKKADYYVIPAHIFNQWVDATCSCIYLSEI